MRGLLFVTQAILDTWTLQGKIDFAGSVMTVLSGEGKGRSYRLEPAVRFLELVGADRDPHGLLHKVKAEAALRARGAEIVADSVLLGDVAYRVDPGFLAEQGAMQQAAASRADPARAAGRTVPPAAGAPSPEEAEERRRQAESLARSLLDHLP